MNTAIQSSARLTPFAYGFRPFFLAAIVYGGLGLAAWLVMRTAGVVPLSRLPPQLWHGHEMLFGFIAAAIAGFLLTAVPSWTGARGFAGTPLIVLSALWLAGRLGFAFASHIPFWLLATVELLFFPALAVLIAVPLLRARNRNTPLLLVIGVLWSVDATFMSAMARGEIALASSALRVGLDIVMLLITVIGGRIVPSFTANALRRQRIAAEVRIHRPLDLATIAAMVAIVVLDVFAPLHPAVAVVTAFAAIAHLVRLAGWQGVRSLREPIVWVLHLGYLWLPVGLALKAVHLATGAGWSADWLHALGAGAAAMMIIAVITRASLGHTGRPLEVSRTVAIAYVVLGCAVLIRAFATAFGAYREWAIWTAGGLWIVAFLLVLGVYTPILMRPRVDGREG